MTTSISTRQLRYDSCDSSDDNDRCYCVQLLLRIIQFQLFGNVACTMLKNKDGRCY